MQATTVHHSKTSHRHPIKPSSLLNFLMPPNFQYTCSMEKSLKIINDPPANKPPATPALFLGVGHLLDVLSEVSLPPSCPSPSGSAEAPGKTRSGKVDAMPLPYGLVGTVVDIQMVETRNWYTCISCCVANLGAQRSLTESKCASFAPKLGRRSERSR